MLTQGPTPDPKCELNIASFVTLPHPLHIAPLLPRISWSLYCYFKLWGDGKVGGWFIYVRVWVGGQEMVIFFFFFFLFCFCAVVNCSLVAGT